MSEPEIREEYLWDKSGPPDPLVQRLEKVLGEHRHRPKPRPAVVLRWKLAAAAAAAVIAVFGFRFFGTDRCYAVDGLAGVRHVRAGDSFVVADGSRAVVEVASLGEVVFQSGSRVRVVDCGRLRHEMFLEEGTLSATIVAEPRVFNVGTPAGMTIDLGCEYDLTVDAEGNVRLHVLKGRVAFQAEPGGREVIVPARSSCEVMLGRAPNTPVQDDATDAFRRAVRAIEFAPDGEVDPVLLDVVVDIDRRDDSLSLVHLLEAPSTRVRERVYAKLAQMYPPAPGASREGILAGDQEMIAAWREGMTKDWWYE